VKYTLIFLCAAILLIIALTPAGSRTIGTALHIARAYADAICSSWNGVARF
jgi:hypothetical protein